MRALALIRGTIYVDPAQEPLRDGVVLIQDGAIVAVGDVPLSGGVQALDCAGLTITAGFWNSHVHFFERKWADAAAIPARELARQLGDTFLRHGFTSVFDTGSMWENTRRLRDRVDAGEVPGPRIRSTGEGLVPPGALPADVVLSLMGVARFPAPEIADAGQAAAAARTLLDAGVDGIKLFASSPRSAPLVDGAIRAAADEAHGSGRPVFVHPNTGADVLAALRGGADVIAHTTPHSGPWDEAILSAVRARRPALTPTLGLWRHFARHDRVSTQERITATASGQLRAWIDAGGVVLFGTDLGAVDPDPAEDYALMAGAGMGFRAILAALTTAPAERFGGSGRIAPGGAADLVVLEGEDVRAFSAVRYTIKAGEILYSGMSR